MLTSAYPPPPPAPAVPEARRYFIMATTSLPAGSAFTTHEPQQHLLTQFALGGLSVADVVHCLSTSAQVPPTAAAIR